MGGRCISQAEREIIEVLQREGRPMTVAEIAQILGKSSKEVTDKMVKARYSGLVRTEVKRTGGTSSPSTWRLTRW